MERLLEVKDLHVHFDIYEGTAQVLNGISFQVRPAERVGLVGETGCGKSVAMKAILGLLPIPPALVPRGQLLFKGEDLLRMSPKELQRIRGRQISMIPQDPMAALNPVFRIGDQLRDVLRYTGNSTGDLKARALSVLQEVKLPDPQRLWKAYPFELSGGMRQRVLIAMALVNEPELLIADEPGTALDVTIQDQILKLLNALVKEKGISVLLITHNLGVIRETTDRVYVMYAGEIVEVAQTKDLFSNPKHPYTQGLLSAVPKLTGVGIVGGIEGRIPDYTDPPSGCRFHPRCPYAMPICQMQKPPRFQVGEEHEAACFLYGR